MFQVSNVITQTSTSPITIATLSLADNMAGGGIVDVTMSARNANEITVRRFIGSYSAVRADSSTDTAFGALLTENMANGIGTNDTLAVAMGVALVINQTSHTVDFVVTPQVLNGTPTSLSVGFVVTDLIGTSLS